jgi:DNA-binding LacI/PurR family transcriptional regulator
MDNVNYSPSRLARGLRNSRTQNINLILGYATGVFQTEVVPRLIAGITSILMESGYELKLCLHRGDASLMKLREFFTDADGVIYASHPLSEEELHFLEARAGTAVVLEDCIPPERAIEKCAFTTVGILNEQGIGELVAHLAGLGHKKIGFVKGHPASRDGAERLTGFRKAMKKAGLDVKEQWIIDGDYLEESGRRAIHRVREKLPELTACVFACDDMAVGALDEGKLLGIRIPEDFSIAGYDNIRLSRICSPKLTTVDQPREKIGQIAAQCLLEQIHQRETRPQHLKLPHQLHVRESTGAPRRKG